MPEGDNTQQIVTTDPATGEVTNYYVPEYVEGSYDDRYLIVDKNGEDRQVGRVRKLINVAANKMKRTPKDPLDQPLYRKEGVAPELGVDVGMYQTGHEIAEGYAEEGLLHPDDIGPTVINTTFNLDQFKGWVRAISKVTKSELSNRRIAYRWDDKAVRVPFISDWLRTEIPVPIDPIISAIPAVELVSHWPFVWYLRNAVRAGLPLSNIARGVGLHTLDQTVSVSKYVSVALPLLAPLAVPLQMVADYIVSAPSWVNRQFTRRTTEVLSAAHRAGISVSTISSIADERLAKMDDYERAAADSRALKRRIVGTIAEKSDLAAWFIRGPLHSFVTGEGPRRVLEFPGMTKTERATAKEEADTAAINELYPVYGEIAEDEDTEEVML